MRELISRASCTGCSACMNACPKKCIHMEQDSEGFLYPQVNELVCVDCGMCKRACPVLNFHIEQEPHFPIAFAAYNCSTEAVVKSSSGGVFTALAEQIILQGGIVYGAAFRKDFCVSHMRVTTLEQLELLHRSKYVQSDIGDAFLLVNKDLRDGKKVLFSGTPCQIAGLKQYLKRDDDNLLCVDIICHSVPSPKVWKEYLKQLAEKEHQRIISVNFRDKRSSWEKYYLCVELADGQEILCTGATNKYMQAFIHGLSTRKSCYQCVFKGQNRGSDITLGDFWGCETACPEAFHYMGTSLVLIQTSKGQRAFSATTSKLTVYQTDLIKALQENPAYKEPACPHKNRSEFFNRLGQEPFGELTERLLAPSAKEIAKQKQARSFINRALRTIKRMVPRWFII